MSPRAVPHPVRAEIYTLGECIPFADEAGGERGDDGLDFRELGHATFNRPALR